jgi:uncharacterized protein (DUF849 family)/N-acetylglutamate synthase-like GNAT family acetyltransferase
LTRYRIEKARPDDHDAILAVMRPWNMHHVPSVEMEQLDLSCFYVARLDGVVVGAAGYQILSQKLGKTTLLGVLEEHLGAGLGEALQQARCEAMFELGVERVITNADRPKTIAWYKKKFGYREVGSLEKLCAFGDPDVDRWTTLEMDLGAHMRRVHAEDAKRRHLARYEPHPLTPYAPVLINVCLTGLVPTRETSPHVPLTPEEIVADALRVCDAGAQLLHLHARDAVGRDCGEAAVYEEILGGIRRERPDVVCCVSLSGRAGIPLERRLEVLTLSGAARPDLASLTLGSLNFPTGASVNEPDTIRRLAQAMQEHGIRPELEVFDTGMIAYARHLEREGLLTGRKYFNLLLGSLGSTPATVGELARMVEALPEDSVWAAAGIGRFQLPMNVAGLVAGGGVRVGLEDNPYYDAAGERPATNEELVERVVRVARELGREPATCAEARDLLGLAPGGPP